MMIKRMIMALAISVALGQAAQAAVQAVGFSQIGSESGWRSAETKVAKTEAEKCGITLKIADAQQAKAGKPNQSGTILYRTGRRRHLLLHRW